MENLNSHRGLTDEQIRAENEAKFLEELKQKESELIAEMEQYEKRRTQFGARKYARLPITIEAYQWFPEMGQTPGLVATSRGWSVETFNGLVQIKEGDYIVQDIAGKFYPVNSDVFN